MFFSQKDHLILVMKEHIDYNQYLDYIIEEGEKNTKDYKKIDMIINIYFEELLTNYKKIKKQRNIVNDIEYTYKKEYKKGNTDGIKYINPLLNETLKVTKLIDELKSDIIVLVNNIK